MISLPMLQRKGPHLCLEGRITWFFSKGGAGPFKLRLGPQGPTSRASSAVSMRLVRGLSEFLSSDAGFKSMSGAEAGTQVSSS